MFEKILLCTDLDRTLLPNGSQVESDQARPLLRRLAARSEMVLAYVTGRSLSLIQEAMDQYDLPVPDFAIGDVGTTIAEHRDGGWQPLKRWERRIGADWRGLTSGDLAPFFEDLEDLRLQPAAQQNVHKLSYHLPADSGRESLLERMRARLTANDIKASLIFSVDETAGIGLLDVLPESATKLHAIRFIMEHLDIPAERTVFAGDSGNDMPALTSGLQAVLVANATDEVRRQAVGESEARGRVSRLYLARGGFMGMNGNYAAGVLEGLVHFLPRTQGWM